MTERVTGEDPKSFAKLNALKEIERVAQDRWEADRAFEIDAPHHADHTLEPKFMATFPFPYMNGRLHIGHAFTVSKAEFAVAYERLKGKRAIFPFAFHCSGMPIKACADKLKREVERFGRMFERYPDQAVLDDIERIRKQEEEDAAKEAAELAKEAGSGKIVKKHSKALSKSTGEKFQFQIMASSYVPIEEIHKFADENYWLTYFPPHCKNDLTSLGLHVDWRRSFITTDANPYFDSFVRWQFNTLRALPQPRIKFGERYTIYSPLDGQACMDHDRAEGEGVGVQEYTAIKLEVALDVLNATPVNNRDTVKDGARVGALLSSPEVAAALGKRRLFLVAATLRPETMYGQTNCYVGVDLTYGIYEARDSGEAYVCTERAAKNMAFQGIFANKGEIVTLATLRGWDLIGVPLRAPLAQYPIVYTLPMEGVLATKGTGVVTSVPSDSPDDFITLQDLVKKPAYYHVQPKWITPFLPPIPIIQTPNYGNLAAVAAVEKLKIQSQKDKKQLAEAKEVVYKEGFYSGVMLVGPQKGRPVQEAKPVIRDLLISQGHAFAYCEPEGPVKSRSGDDCVVTLADQWYMDYGEEAWRKQAEECLSRMETFAEETRNSFAKTLEWLNQWACSRSFGLGTRFPWDEQYLVESLSDSTIYMAYYTVSHILHGGNFDGSTPGSGNIKPDQMTDDVWNYIFRDGPFPKSTKIAKATLDKMRDEFRYFYPLDLRVSGKDLVPNHLTFFIYNHVAMFKEDHWPKGVRVNGHLLLNGAKMSKSTGNFMTVFEAVGRYGADATRFALADAGDSQDDANFLHKTADDAVLKLHTEKEFVEQLMADHDAGKLRTGEHSWNDRVFAAEMDRVVAACDDQYRRMNYREALKYGFFELQNAKAEYRKATLPPNNQVSFGPQSVGDSGETFEGFHRDIAVRFVEISTLVLTPITPHYCEHVWSTILKKPKSVQFARWPETSSENASGDLSILSASNYIRQLVHQVRGAEDLAARKRQKAAAKGNSAAAGAAPAAAASGPRKLVVFWARSYPEWQTPCIEALKKTLNPTTGEFSGDEREHLPDNLKKDKRVMPFISNIKKLVREQGTSVVLDRRVPFNEETALLSNRVFIRRELAGLKVDEVVVVAQGSPMPAGVSGDVAAKVAETAEPGSPSFIIV